MNQDRRSFLVQTAVLGLGALFEPRGGVADAGLGPVQPPLCALLKSALQRMASENKPGIAVRIPADPARRHDPGHALVSTLNGDCIEIHELFAEAVVVCLESDVFQKELRGVDASHSVVLFDGQRQVLAGHREPITQDWRPLRKALETLLHGEDGQRLRQRAEAAREKAGPALRAAFDRLDGPEDRALLQERAATLISWLVHERRQPSTLERRKAEITGIVRGYIDRGNLKAPGPRLPFGLEAASGVAGCGDSCAEREESKRGAVPCGMARMGSDVRSFVRYLKT